MKHFPHPLVADRGAARAARLQLAFTTSAGTVTRVTSSLINARAEYEAFCRNHAGDRAALASIYDLRGWKYVEGWWGGDLIGPRDALCPLERMMRRAVAAGQRVYVGGLGL